MIRVVLSDHTHLPYLAEARRVQRHAATMGFALDLLDAHAVYAHHVASGRCHPFAFEAPYLGFFLQQICRTDKGEALAVPT